MQYLKEDIKNRILAVALEEFYNNGFRKASMLKIAHNAKIAIGNIYRYFKNKEDLFNEIMEPAYNQILTLVFNQYGSASAGEDMQFDAIDVVNAVMEVYMKFRTELLIMMDKSEGSKFENIKEQLVNLVYERELEYYLPLFEKNGIPIKDSFIYVLADSLVHGIFMICRNTADTEEVKEQIGQLLAFHFSHIVERFK